uniref:Uncharacterized protein n=1 Tax=Anguilla anguilla TaxID=7936 RepID=A0A0E9R786_ANGAN
MANCQFQAVLLLIHWFEITQEKSE